MQLKFLKLKIIEINLQVECATQPNVSKLSDHERNENLFILTLTMLINDVKYDTDKKNMANDMETIQYNNIVSLTQASQTRNRDCSRI